jgi:hypothetical protein
VASVAARAQAPDPLRARARGHRKVLAKNLGVRLTELDALTREAISVYCLCKATQSILDPARDPERALRAANATGRAWLALERRLREVGLDGGKPNGADALANHVRDTYGGRNGGSS